MVHLHDRYLYLAAYPFCALIAYALLHGPHTGPWGGQMRFVAALVLVATLASVTWHESGYWRNEVSLWERATETAPNTANPWLRVAGMYSGDLRSMKAVAVIDEGLRYRPNSPFLWQARGLLLFDREQTAAARQAFLKVIEVASSYDLQQHSDVAYQKTGAVFHLGVMDLRAGNYVSAERWIRESIALEPQIPELHLALAEALRKQGRLNEARQEESPFSAKQGTYGVP